MDLDARPSSDFDWPELRPRASKHPQREKQCGDKREDLCDLCREHSVSEFVLCIATISFLKDLY